MKKILFPTDFSSSAQHAFQYALAFAKEYNAQIEVLNVFNPTPINSELGYIQMDEVIKHYRTFSELKLEEFVIDAPKDLIIGTAAVFGMFIPQEISCYAEDHGHDVIFMGTQGEHSMIEKMLGSITTYTMLKSSCPVLAIPQSSEYKSIQQIAYATDFRPKSLLPIKSLRSIAHDLNAQLSLVHVTDHSETPISMAAKNVYLEAVDDLNTEIINNPSIEEGLDEYIKANDINWLSLFLPRRRLIERLFHHSFSKQMTFHSNTPILVFKV